MIYILLLNLQKKYFCKSFSYHGSANADTSGQKRQPPSSIVRDNDVSENLEKPDLNKFKHVAEDARSPEILKERKKYSHIKQTCICYLESLKSANVNIDYNFQSVVTHASSLSEFKIASIVL